MENEKQNQIGTPLKSDYDSFNVGSWGVRHSQCLLLMFTLTIAYSMRACIGVALVGMVLHMPAHGSIPNVTEDMANFTLANGTEYDLNSTSIDGEDDFEFDGFFNAILLTPPFPRFQWSKKVQDLVMASFFWGYMTLQIPGGQLVHRFGARYLLIAALTANCLIAMIFPIASYYGGWVCALICRMSQGLSQACIVPSIHTVLGKWSPLEERGRMSAIIGGGQALGTVLGLPITGFLSSSPLGWPGIFRFYGFLSGVIAVVLWFLMADSPALHKRISAGERRYIEEALGQTGEKKTLPVPWKKILTSYGMMAIVAAHIGNTWGQLILYSEVPSYMNSVIGVNIKANGLLTALPFLVMWFANFLFSWIFDMIIVKKYLSVTHTRKLANSVGSIPAAIGLILLGYAPNNIYIVETLLILICVFKVATHSAFYVNHVDISPNFAGTMMSISNFISNVVGSQAPMIAGAILTDVTDASLWRIVFFITAGFYFFSNLVYVLLGSADLAEWNDADQYEKVAMNEYEDTEKRDKIGNKDANNDTV